MSERLTEFDTVGNWTIKLKVGEMTPDSNGTPHTTWKKREFNVFNVLALGKGSMQRGLEEAYSAVEKNGEVISQVPVETSRYNRVSLERITRITEDGDIVVSISEVFRNSSGSIQANNTGDIYTPYELIALGRGSMVEGRNRVHEAIEDAISQGGEDEDPMEISDMNVAMGMIDPLTRPLQGELDLMFDSSEDIPKH